MFIHSTSSTTIDAIARTLARLHILVVVERLNKALLGVQVEKQNNIFKIFNLIMLNFWKQILVFDIVYKIL